MKRAVSLAAFALVACGPTPRPIDPVLLHPPRARNNAPLTATSLAMGGQVSGILPCDEKLYYRVDGLTEGARVQVRLRVETGSPYRFCHQAAFPDRHDQYTYTDLLGCAGEGAPSEVSAETMAEGATLYIRLWRNGAPDPACIAARFTLSVEAR
jgi:hypothetical protein